MCEAGGAAVVCATGGGISCCNSRATWRDLPSSSQLSDLEGQAAAKVLLRDLGANPDQIIELSGLAEEYHFPDQDDCLSSPDMGTTPAAKAKAKRSAAHGLDIVE